MKGLSKRQMQLLLILFVAAVVFSLVVFLIPFPKGAVFWIAYIAELIALGLQIPLFKLAFDNAEELKSKVLGFPVFRVGYLYLGIQTALSLVLFALGFIPRFPVWLAAVLCILVLGGALICSITADIAREEVERVETAAKVDTQLMRTLRTRSAQLVNRANDSSLKQELERLSESIQYSDPVSSPAIAEVEARLENAFAQLESAVSGGDTSMALGQCKNVTTALAERNAACRNNKRK